eukprot:SAG22_NODE_195_length_15606_cov_21.340878_6_plen_40_part_00
MLPYLPVHAHMLKGRTCPAAAPAPESEESDTESEMMSSS